LDVEFSSASRLGRSLALPNIESNFKRQSQRHALRGPGI
jgi:hypothetical protein